MENKRRGPIGIELVRRGLVNQDDINKALNYQRENPNKKIIEIINPNKDLVKQCSLPLNEKKEECSASCISCGKCDSKDFKLEYCPHMCIKKSPIIVNKGFKFWEFCYKIFHKDEISK
mgnify:CR=1 FL=1